MERHRGRAIDRRFAPRSAFACLFMIWTPSGRFALGGKVG
jgi:hypothetical protein